MRQSSGYSVSPTTTPTRRDPVDAAAVGVDQTHIGPVEGLQVLVVEAGPLAELAVPGLEGLRGLGVARRSRRPGRGSAPSSRSRPSPSGPRCRRRQRHSAILQPHDQLADDVGPAVHHQVLVGHAPEVSMVKFSIRSLLPAGWQRGRPLRIGRPVGPDVDRRRRALEHVQLLGRLAEVGNDLHRRGAGADDADGLVAEPGQAPARIAAGVVVVPPAGVERMAREGLDAGMPGSFGRWSGPLPMTTNRATSSSPRLVRTSQRRPGGIPLEAGDLGREAGSVRQPELLGDARRSAPGSPVRGSTSPWARSRSPRATAGRCRTRRRTGRPGSGSSTRSRRSRRPSR